MQQKGIILKVNSSGFPNDTGPHGIIVWKRSQPIDLNIATTVACRTASGYANLVSMTRTAKTPPEPKVPRLPGRWALQDAKARFSELVRRVRTEGPQHVTVHGRDEVVVISAEDFRRLRGDRTGEALIAAMQASPDRDVDIEPGRARLPVRDVDL
jgi:prevent-host-death family protein